MAWLSRVWAWVRAQQYDNDFTIGDMLDAHLYKRARFNEVDGEPMNRAARELARRDAGDDDMAERYKGLL